MLARKKQKGIPVKTGFHIRLAEMSGNHEAAADAMDLDFAV